MGRAHFLADLEFARELAALMVEIGVSAGKRVSALLSPINRPSGGLSAMPWK